MIGMSTLRRGGWLLMGGLTFLAFAGEAQAETTAKLAVTATISPTCVISAPAVASPGQVGTVATSCNSASAPVVTFAPGASSSADQAVQGSGDALIMTVAF